ncbi:MAG: molybdopterin-guanine dinucleotide biosynthesis protein B [Gammaproteobacteria bacterium]|nr:molybdopterin-guanine dinucleotide biosynthesis protein B [Gammaproteobacteria bacterium]
MNKTPIIGFAASSGTGKTTLLLELIPLLKEQGVRIAVIKHSHHDFDIDQPGKDSYRLRKSGADQTLIASAWRWALITETPEQKPPTLNRLVQKLDHDQIDMILVEGFKHESFPKIELHRIATGKALLYPDDSSIIAIACDTDIKAPITCLDINNPARIAEYITQYLLKHPYQ